MSSKDVILFDETMGTRHAAVAFSHTEEHLFPCVDECCELTVECPVVDFSASRIAQAVEDADANMLNMNVTSSEPSESGCVVVDIRVSHRDAGSVARSLERYDFRVLAVSGGEDRYTEVTRNRIRELMAHLEV